MDLDACCLSDPFICMQLWILYARLSRSGPSSISLALCKIYVGHHTPMVAQFPMSKVFIAFNIFFKVKMLRHLWWYCTDVISSLPKSLMMCRTGMTLDFCGFQQSFPWVQVLKCHLPLNSGKCNLRELAALVGCINLLNLSCFSRVLSEPVAYCICIYSYGWVRHLGQYVIHRTT